MRRLCKKGKSVAFSYLEVIQLSPRGMQLGHRAHARSNSMGDGAIMSGMRSGGMPSGPRPSIIQGATGAASLRSSLRAQMAPGLQVITAQSGMAAGGSASGELGTPLPQPLLSPISASLHILSSSATSPSTSPPPTATTGGGAGGAPPTPASASSRTPKRRGKSVFFSEEILAFSPIAPLEHSANSRSMSVSVSSSVNPMPSSRAGSFSVAGADHLLNPLVTPSIQRDDAGSVQLSLSTSFFSLAILSFFFSVRLLLQLPPPVCSPMSFAVTRLTAAVVVSST